MKSTTQYVKRFFVALSEFLHKLLGEAGQNRLLQAGGTRDCGLRISDCGLMREPRSSSIRIPQSTIRNRITRPLAAGGSDLLFCKLSSFESRRKLTRAGVRVKK